MVYQIIVINRWGATCLNYTNIADYLVDYKRLSEDLADVILQGNTYPVGGNK